MYKTGQVGGKAGRTYNIVALHHRFQISLPAANQSTLRGRLKTTLAAILVSVITLAILAAAFILGSLIALVIGVAIAIALAAGVVKVALQRRR